LGLILLRDVKAPSHTRTVVRECFKGDEASDHLGSFLSCVIRGSPLVRAVAHHALKIARYNSVIGSNALFCCARYGWTAADLLAGKIDVSDSYFQKICDNSLRAGSIVSG